MVASSSPTPPLAVLLAVQERLLAPRRYGLWLLVLAVVPSHALASVRVGVGADYWIDQGGEFNFTLTALAPLTRGLGAGVRFGAALATDPTVVGIPLDLQLRATLTRARLYLEGSAGPWILFTDDRPVRAHAAFGFGLETRSISFGIELGWLNPNGIVGIRLGLKL